MSSEIRGENPLGRISKVSRVKLSALGKSGPKARTRVVADGQQVEIPVLRYNRTVGTRAESGSREPESPVQVRYQSHRQIRVAMGRHDADRNKVGKST